MRDVERSRILSTSDPTPETYSIESIEPQDTILIGSKESCIVRY